jgi:hypothetical protein
LIYPVKESTGFFYAVLIHRLLLCKVEEINTIVREGKPVLAWTVLNRPMAEAGALAG